MRIPLESLTSCFQGLIPSWLCTCSKDGVPNVAVLSHVDYVDARHVALSFQFFNKSKRNISENPQAMVRLYDPDTLQVYLLRLRFVRTETQGPTFESMRLRIEAIASHTGLKGIFKLLGADIYEVLSVAPAEDEVGLPSSGRAIAHASGTERSEIPFTMRALQELSDQIHRAPTLDCLLDSILETLENIFGFRHAMILLASERPDRLEMIASRGYPEGGVGSEVGFGDGIIGMVAEAQKPIRISGMLRQMLYAYAVAKRAEERGLCPDERRIPLPGLANPESQLGIPLLVRDELIGVLCIESEESYRFHEEDRAYLEVLGGYLAIAIQNALLRERYEEPEDTIDSIGSSASIASAGGEGAPCSRVAAGDASSEGSDAAGGGASAGNGQAPRTENRESGARAERSARSTATLERRVRIEVAYYKTDECILVDGEYLIRSLPAKILRKILLEHQEEGRKEFTNRQLRLDKSLDLPVLKDNLESRLILLRRRLDERCPEITIAQSGRGRFRLELETQVVLVERP